MGRHPMFVILGTLAIVAFHPKPAQAQPARDGEIRKQTKYLRQLFPEFENRKSGLGPLTLLADVVVVEDVKGEPENVFREDSRSIGQKLLDTLTAGFTEKGYTLASGRLVSVGDVTSGASPYRVLDTWEQREQELSQFPVLPRPVYRDSVFGASDSLRADWHELFSGVWSFRKKRNEPTTTLPSVSHLRGAIGTDYAIVVVLVGTRATMGKLLVGSAFGDMPLFGKKSSFKLQFDAWEEIHFDRDVDFDKYSGTGLRLAVVDCRSGEILYSDAEHDRWGVQGPRLDILVRDMIRRMI